MKRFFQKYEDKAMAIVEHKGDLLAVPEGLIVHGCNTLGVMGAGIAKAIKAQYPSVYHEYRRVFEKSGLHLGQTILVPVAWHEAVPSKIFVNAMTQDRLAQRPGEVVVSYAAISKAFQSVREEAQKRNLAVHFPLIGCGLAGGDWSEVSTLIEEALGPDVEMHLWRN